MNQQTSIFNSVLRIEKRYLDTELAVSLLLKGSFNAFTFFLFRTPAGYCFVDFGDYAASQKVMSKLNGLPIPGSNPVSGDSTVLSLYLETLKWLEKVGS